MIKCKIKKEKVSAVVKGKVYIILSEAALFCIEICYRLAKSKEEFNAFKKVIADCLLDTSYEEVLKDRK